MIARAFGIEHSYIPNNKYSLGVLKRGLASVNLGAMSNALSSVSIKNFSYKKPNGAAGTIKNEDMHKELLRLSNEGAFFTQVELSFFVNGSMHSVKICEGNKSEFPETLDEELVEKFLTQNGFIKDDYGETNFELLA